MHRWKDSSRSLLAASRSFSINRVANIIPPVVLFASISWVYQDVEADSCNNMVSEDCKACVSEVVEGRLRLESGNGLKKEKTKGKFLIPPLCVLEIERKRFLVRIHGNQVRKHENQDNLPGDWWIKKRFVLKSSVASGVNVDDCSTVEELEKYTMVGTPDSMGTTRGSGENPCK